MSQIFEQRRRALHDRRSARRRRYGAVATMAVMALVGCDLSVTNPGPVQDSFLDDDGAFPAVVNGARRGFALAYTRLALDAAMMAREAEPGGLFGTDFYLGNLTSDNAGDHWGSLHQARYLAEDAARRIEEAGGGGSAEYVQALLLAAYTNRTMGHHMCIAVFDGGAAQPYTDHFTAAEAQFDEVISIAGASSAAGQAALAGRADVNLWQGQWAEAYADAIAVTSTAMTYQLEYYDLLFADTNEMAFRQASLPWREYTVWNTFMEDYYTTSGDPRMRWRTNPAEPNTMVNNLPFYVQLKFEELTAPHTLASGWEMLLIQAEAILRGAGSGDFNDAMDLINQVRTRNVSDNDDQPLAPWTAANATEAWVALKQERRIEMWGEAKRFGSLRRWVDQAAPGNTPMEDVSGRSNCFPPSTTEVNTNPNGITKITADNTTRFP